MFCGCFFFFFSSIMEVGGADRLIVAKNLRFYVEFSLKGGQGILPWFCERTEKEEKKKSLYWSSEEEVGKGDFVTGPASLGIMS